MKKEKLFTYLVLLNLCWFATPLKAQQWFAKSFDFNSAINEKPDYRTSGTYVTTDEDENATGVLVYGIMGYSEHELTASNGGFGKQDGVILYNDLEGNNLWAITLGTNKADYISRVVEDSDGNLAVTGYTVVNGTKKVFIIKLDGSSQGIVWARFYGEGIPTDMINVNDTYSILNSTGYAVSGSRSDGSAFVIYTQTSGSQHWAHKYSSNGGSLALNSLIQLKGKDNLIYSPPTYREFLAVAGSNNGEGYVMRLDLANGDILNDLQMGHAIPICAGAVTPDEYVSIDQRGDGDIVVFGSSGSNKNRIHLTSLSDYNNFTINWNRTIYGGASTHGFPLDINVTKQGYLGVFEYSGGTQNPFKTVEYDFDGTIVKMQDLANGTMSGIDWYFAKEKHQTSGADAFPYVDFGMECGRALHFSGTETTCPNPPVGWAQDNIPHARIRLNAQSCVEMDISINDSYCDDYYVGEPELEASKNAWISDSDFDLLVGVQYINPNQTTYCESSCPQSACVSPNVLDVEQGTIITLSADPGYDGYVWSVSENSEFLDVFVRGDFSSYSVDQIDANGCVTTKTFSIFGRIPGKRARLGENSEQDVSLTVYPNPANDWLTVEVPTEGIALSIYDMTGRLVKLEKDLTPGVHNINISSYPEGIYVIRLSGKGINKEFKISKE